MKKLIPLLIIFILLASFCNASTRPIGMGGAFVAVADDANAVYYNPAGMAFMKSSELVYNYRYHHLEEPVSSYDVAFVTEFLWWHMGLRTHGYDVYDETNVLQSHDFTISYAGLITDQIAIGFNVNASQQNSKRDTITLPFYFSSYKNSTYMDIGLLYKPAKYLSIGIMQHAVRSPYYSGYNDDDPGHIYQPMSAPLNIGIAVYPWDGLLIAIDASKDVDTDNQYWGQNYGFEYTLTDQLVIRSGIAYLHPFANEEYWSQSTIGLSFKVLPGLDLDFAKTNSDNVLTDYLGFRWDF